MVDVVYSVGGLLVALLLVLLNGFFVASEFALVRIRGTRVDAIVEEGRFGAETMQEAVENLDDYLATTQLGITLASLGLGWIGEPAVAALIEPVVGSLFPGGALHLVSFALAFGFITFLHVVFGELAPKTIAIQEAERIALLVAVPMKLFYYLFIPGIIVFNGTANFFTRLIGVSPASETDETHGEDEIMMILGRSGEHGAVDVEEVEMIEAIFELDDTIAREVMVPRPDVVSVAETTTLPELREIAIETGHTRYPVLGDESGDDVIGFLDVKDVLRAGEEGDDSVTAGNLARDLPIVPETGAVDDLLEEFRRRQVQMAAVIDEWGAFAGIVTVEDVVEVVVGDMRDQFDRSPAEPSIDRRGDGSYVVDGSLILERVNAAVGSDFESEQVETIGGLALSRLGRAPEVDDRVAANGYALRVAAVDGDRISTLVLEPLSEDEDGTDDDARESSVGEESTGE